MPEIPAAAPIAAPAAPAAPSSAPATPAAPEPAAAAAPPAAPATPQGEAAPAAEAPAVEIPAAASAAPEPTRTEFGDDIESFLKAHMEWEENNREGAPAEEPAAEAEEAEELEAEAPKAEDAEAPTPEGLSKLLQTNPARKEFLESDPEFKGALFAMARQNAKAAEVIAIVPNAEAARFAVEHANQFVGLKTSIQLADSPEKMAKAAEGFLQQFQIVDDKGAPVLDAKGNKTYGEDLPMFVATIKGRDNAVRMESLKERLAANQYATPAGKENDELLLSAYEHIAAAEAADPAELDRPDVESMSPEARTYFEKKEKELQEERERLGLKDKDLTKKQQGQVRERFETKYREEFGGSTGKFIANYLAQKEKEGVAIPRWWVERQIKDPKTGNKISHFALDAFNQLNEKLDKVPNFKSTSASLQMNAINEAGLAARVKHGQDAIADYLPDIIDGLLKEAGVSLVSDAKKAQERREQRQQTARVEPAAGGKGTLKHLSEEQLYAQAKANVEAKNKGAYMDPAKKIEEVLKEKFRLEDAR